MKQIWPRQIWQRLSKREKNLAAASLVILVMILARYFLLSPYVERRDWVKSQLEIQPQLLEKNLRYIDRKAEIMASLEKSREELKAMEPALLSGDTPSVIASELQLTVQSLATKENTQVITMRVLNPEPMGSFTRIPIQVEIGAQIDQMANLLKRIESAEKLLLINDVNIHALFVASPQQRRPEAAQAPAPVQQNLRVSMIVSGFARSKTPPGSKGEPGAGAAKSEKGRT